MTVPKNQRISQNHSRGANSLNCCCEIVIPYAGGLNNAGTNKNVEAKKEFLLQLKKSVNRKVKAMGGETRWYNGGLK